ncbi:MAG: hypothetical protein R3268_00805 [Acidiferrobacterales bacterium]|nr:hypothetical protein [Acidiferrobacterales bacterium]
MYARGADDAGCFNGNLIHKAVCVWSKDRQSQRNFLGGCKVDWLVHRSRADNIRRKIVELLQRPRGNLNGITRIVAQDQRDGLVIVALNGRFHNLGVKHHTVFHRKRTEATALNEIAADLLDDIFVLLPKLQRL